ncbi:hypothetical protein L0F63_002548, partial [Massospora cicadina]
SSKMSELIALPSQNSSPAMNPNTHRACDDCRTRKVKCKPTATSCEACEKRMVPCTFVNPILKRGPKPRGRDGEQGNEESLIHDMRFPGTSIISAPKSVLNGRPQAKKARVEVPLPSEELPITPDANGLTPPVGSPLIVKSDEYGSLSVGLDSKGRKMAHFYLCIREEPHAIKYTPVSSTSLHNHPLAFLSSDTCQTHQVLGLLTSQQIYITIIFFTYVYPSYPSLDLVSFEQQLRQPMTTSFLFLLNCICAVACPYGSNNKARFDKTQFYHKALEIHYHHEEPETHPNWAYGHLLLKILKPKSNSL